MSVFEGIKIDRCCWRATDEKLLTKQEKEFVKCAIVVRSQFGLSLEFFTTKGPKQIPISTKICPPIGYIPNIDNIKVITLCKEGEEFPIYRIEF